MRLAIAPVWFIEMHVCHLYLHGLSPQRGGGVASNLYGLISSTHEIIDYLLMTGYEKQDMRIAAQLYEGKASIHSIQLRNFAIDAIALARRYRIFSRCDVVHFNDFYDARDILRSALLILLLRILSRTKLVFGSHTAQDQTIGSALWRGLHNFLFRGLSKCWERVVCNSNYMAHLMVQFYRVPRNRISVIPNGVTVELYRKAVPMSLTGDPVILFVGHLWPEKGVDLLLKAFRFLNQKIPSSFLHIVGSGEHKGEYKGLARELRIQGRVKFHGSKPSDELAKIYKGADICVFPSRVESFGIVLLEAMASGRPIVATKVGGVSEIIKHARNGLLAELTVESIGGALLELARDHDLCRRMQEYNELDSVMHDWKYPSEIYVNLYKQICKM